MGTNYSAYPFLVCPERECVYMTKKLWHFAEHVGSHGKTLPFEVFASGWLSCSKGRCDFRTKDLARMMAHTDGHWPHIVPKIMVVAESLPLTPTINRELAPRQRR